LHKGRRERKSGKTDSKKGRKGGQANASQNPDNEKGTHPKKTVSLREKNKQKWRGGGRAWGHKNAPT